MRPDIKAMLPELPEPYQVSGDYYSYTADSIKAWLDKLTEGAQVLYGAPSGMWDDTFYEGDTHTALLICPREIKKQTPLEIAVEGLKQILVVHDDHRSAGWRIAKDSLAQIEAAK